MAIDVRWYVEGRVIQCTMWDVVTTKEMTTSVAQGIAMIRESEASGAGIVHDILDMRGVTGYPTNLGEIINATPIFKEPNLGWVLLLSSDRLVNFLATVATGVARARLRVFHTPDEATAFLREIDLTLPPLPAFTVPVEV